MHIRFLGLRFLKLKKRIIYFNNLMIYIYNSHHKHHNEDSIPGLNKKQSITTLVKL